jgi:hypothetical protein
MTALPIPSVRLFPTWKPAGGVAPVALRQIRPDDAAGLRGFVRDLSPASRRLRFHAALNELPEATLQALTCVDQRGHVAPGLGPSANFASVRFRITTGSKESRAYVSYD